MTTKKIILVLSMIMLCSVMQAQFSKNISVGLVPYGGSLIDVNGFHNELYFGFNLDYEKRFVDKSGNGMFTNSGALTASTGLLFGDFNSSSTYVTASGQDSTVENQTKLSFFLNVGMEWILNAKSRVQFPLGMEMGLGLPPYFTGFSLTAKMKVFITNQLGVYVGARVTNFGILYYVNCGLVYTLGS